MKERPILFNGEMVRAILDGRKTMTRRPIKPQPLDFGDHYHWGKGHYYITPKESFLETAPQYSPFGGVGCHLYVRETWAIASWFADVGNETHRFEGVRRRATDSADGVARWRPSIHMPKWASRITLEVEREWCERVNEISYDDIVAEGWDVCHSQPCTNGTAGEDARELMRATWDSIYAKKGFGWDDNPWIFGCEFKVLEVKE